MGFNRSRSFKTVKYVLETVKSFIPSPALEKPSIQSPFPALLRSNEPASDEEAKVVREFIATLDTLRATAASHQEASTLYAPPSHQEQRLSSLISTHRGIISTCRRIPDEIWQDIFIFAVEPTAVPATGLNRRKNPWRISCVCRRWNAIAISTPLLWTHIFVDASSVRGVDLVHRPSGYLSKSLERSKTAPLSVSIVNHNSHLVVQDDLLELLEHCNRWKHLRIKAPLDWIQLLRHRVKGSLSSLESLDFEPIRGHPFDPGQLIHLHCDLFEEAPKLREVRISDRDRVMGRVQLPWSQLIQLRHISCRTHPLQEITNTARRLSSLSLCEFGQLPVKPLPTIIDLDLADNECSISDGWNISQIFPSLQTLSIKGSDPPFMARIQPQLCQLTLLQCLTLKGLTHSLLPLPDITTLRILRIDLPSKEELVRFIVRKPAGSEGVFPSLEDLHIFMPSLLDSDAARRLRYIDQSDLYRVLNLVARTRCRRSPQSDLGLVGPSNTLFPLSAHPNTPTISRCTTATTLKSFRLEFWSNLTFSGSGCTVHEQIESAWEREDSFYSSISSAWEEELATLEPWLEFIDILILVESRGKSMLPLADALHWREKDRKFRQFEALEIVDLKSLYISGLHRVLRELLDLRFFYREVEQRFNQYHFRERIRAILDKWAPRFQEDLPNRHWHLCHKQILAYVAEDDPIRKDPDALKIIYGPYNTDHNSESRELWNAEKPHLSYCRPLITNHWASDF